MTKSVGKGLRILVTFTGEIPNGKLHFLCSVRRDPTIFTSIASANGVFQTLKSTKHFLPQPTMSRRSDSSSEINSSCCHRSDASPE